MRATVPINSAAVQKIGLDLRALDPEFKAHFGRGTGRYVRELVKQFDNSDRREIAIHKLQTVDLQLSKAVSSFLQNMPAGKVTLETQFFLPSKLKALVQKNNLSLVHFFSHGDAPASFFKNYLVTVLDLIPLRFPELYKANKATWRFHLARYLELKSIRNAKGIITISEASKKDIIELLDIPAEKIVVTPLAVSRDFVPLNKEQDKNALYQKFSLDSTRPLIVYVGGIDPRKNLPFFISAFAELLQTIDSDKEKPQLVLVGRYEKEREYSALLKQIKELGIESFVTMPGFVSDEDLPLYYNLATFTVFPSLYEGFGFPVLESMACGTPVIAGDNSSIPEVAGDAGILCSATNKEQWLVAMKDLLDDRDKRQKLSEVGIARAKEFSWKSTAEKTIEAYRYFLES